MILLLNLLFLLLSFSKMQSCDEGCMHKNLMEKLHPGVASVCVWDGVKKNGGKDRFREESFNL